MAYTKKQIIEMCEKASEDMKSFYKANFVNYKGKTIEAEGGEWYSEIVAEWLLDNVDKFSQIQRVERSTSYDTKHTGKLGEKTNRVEEYVAKLLFNSKKDYNGLGRIIDYQTPLKNPRGSDNDGLGKIDLLSRNDKSKCVYLLELKKESSDETMLRCVLESYTYLCTISKEKLFKDFGIPSDYELRASPLVFLNGVQDIEFSDAERRNLHLLMKKLNSTPFFIEEKTVFDIIEK